MLEWDKRRDFFPASVAAIQMNRARSKQTDKVWSADDLLNTQYFLPKDTGVMITDPDRGAAGGEMLKAGLRGLTEKNKQRRRKFTIHNAKLHS